MFHSQRLMLRLVKLRQLDGQTIREETENELKDEASANSEPVPLGTAIQHQLLSRSIWLIFWTIVNIFTPITY